jgi:glycerol-3-phosphate dehydrogenase (NAD(P)+)
MTRIAVIGGGSFGTAMACVARRAGHHTIIWAREPEVVRSINAGQGNPFFLESVLLETGIAATSDIEVAVNSADLVVFAVPAQHVRAVATQIRPALRPGTPLVSCSKGIERGTCALMPEVLAGTLPDAVIAVLAGPSFAREVGLGLPTGVILACADIATAQRVAAKLRSPAFQVYTSSDPISATVGGAFKNVLAIACGIAIARKMGDNVRGLLIARGLYEMACIARAKGGNPLNLLGLAGAGDVMLSCTGTQSRNVTFGMALGQGRSAADILAERKVVTEGVHSAASISELGRRLGVPVPLAATINRIVNENASIDAVFSEAFAGRPGPELAGLN